MNGIEILWPVMLQIALTLVLYFLMFRVRVGLLKAGEARASEFRTYENEHTDSRKWSRAIANQYELPVLFYVLCVLALVTQNVDVVMLSLAWAFTFVKTAHVFLHVTSNRLRYRQPVFSLAFVIVILMMIWFGLSLAGWVSL